MTAKKPWWQTEHYDRGPSVPNALSQLAGPNGVATVSVNANGTTQPGWGHLGRKNPAGNRDDGFMPRYLRREFDQRKTDWQFHSRRQPFAIVMRSINAIAVDIDGKNDGFVGARALGELPRTLAETSKSGNGFHLFYAADDTWDPLLGFAVFDDHIGIAQGVDLRATGCVFHYASQRWNDASLASLPDQLKQLLQLKKENRMFGQSILANTKDTDMDDKLVAHHTLITDLNMPIPTGKRNNTLFAIGSKMKTAGVESWDELVYNRARDVGLDQDEATKLVDNISAYGV